MSSSQRVAEHGWDDFYIDAVTASKFNRGCALYVPCLQRQSLRRRERSEIMGNAWVIDAVRTPRGRGKIGKGALSGVHPQELLAQSMNALVERTKVDRAAIEDVVVGCVSQSRAPASRATRCSRQACPTISPACRSTASAAPASRR
jgi:hypothetical protein